MKPLRWYSILLIFAALAIFGAAYYFVHFKESQKKRTLEIRDAASGRVYHRWLLDETSEFAVEFIHSVHQSPVRESYRIDGRMILPLAARFSSFGAGMQSDLEEGQILSRDGDALVITGFGTSYRELNYIVGTVSDHLLFINNETVSLRDLCGMNAHIVIRIK